MQIEFIGCTSAGKSTFVKGLLKAGQQQNYAVVNSYEDLLARAQLGWTAPNAVRMVLLNLIALASATVTYCQQPTLLRLILSVLRALPASISWRERVKIMRITSRNLGIHCLAGKAPATKVILADEGAVQVIHYLFVHLHHPPDFPAIERYLAQITLPDLIVYYRQPEAVLVERTERRGHKRIQPQTQETVRTFIGRAHRVFESLARSPLLADRLLIIDGQSKHIVQEPHGPSAQAAMQMLHPLLVGWQRENSTNAGQERQPHPNAVPNHMS